VNKDRDATVVILNRNGEKIIERCLSSIMAQTIKNLEIIVVDNNSTDRSNEIIKAFPSVKLIINKSNLGFTGGNWVGIRNASSEYVAFINNDTALDKDWMKHILSIIISDPIIGVVGGKVLKPDGSVDSIGGCIYYPSGRQFDRRYESGGIEDVVAVPGSAFMVKKSVALKVGFLDIDFFMLYDEVDFFWRLRLAGYRCVYFPKALSWHLHSYTFSREWTYFIGTYFLIRNMMWSNLKNLDNKHLIPYVLFEISFSMKLIAKLLLSGNDKNVNRYAKAYFIAVAKTLLSMKTLYQKRRYVQSIRKVQDTILLKEHARNDDIFSKLFGLISS